MNYPYFEEFFNKILKEIDEIIEKDVIDDLQNKKKILIVKTVNDHVFEEFLDILVQRCPKADLYVIGDCRNINLSKYMIKESYSFEGRFSADLAEKMLYIRKKIAPDAIIFQCHMLYRTSYLNVMEFVEALGRELPIYSYVRTENFVVRYQNLIRLVKSLELLRPLAEYGDSLL